MRIGSFFGIAALGVLTFTLGCESSEERNSLQASLNGRTFVSESVEGWQLVPNTEVRITFTESELRASAGCNSLNGTYELSGTVLELPSYGSTGMGCDAERHAQDDWLISFLRDHPTLALDEPKLVMTTSKAKLTLVDREVQSPDRPLVGTHWIGAGFSDGSGFSGVMGQSDITIEFFGAGTVAIDTSCQHGTASFQADGDTLSFSDLVYDGEPCSDELHQLLRDKTVLVLNGAPVTHSIEEARLELKNGENSLFFRSNE